jgi:hypothetical protein
LESFILQIVKDNIKKHRYKGTIRIFELREQNERIQVVRDNRKYYQASNFKAILEKYRLKELFSLKASIEKIDPE